MSVICKLYLIFFVILIFFFYFFYSHIFYQVCCGLEPAMKKSLFLETPADYYYLNQGQCLEIEEGLDAKLYQKTISALTRVGVSDDEIIHIFGVLSTILNLGNITFIP